MIESGPSGYEESAAARKEFILKIRDGERREASALERDIAEVQAARYESALLVLMKRTEDNPELINAMKGFLDAIEQRAMYGDGTSKMKSGSEVVEKMTRFFTEARAQLWALVGVRSVNDPEPWIK